MEVGQAASRRSRMVARKTATVATKKWKILRKEAKVRLLKRKKKMMALKRSSKRNDDDDQ